MWGEINQNTDTIELESDSDQNMDLSSIMEQSRQKDCLSMYHVSSSVNEKREISLPPMDSRMLYAASLHQYNGTISDVIKDAELAITYNLTMPSEPPIVVVPETPAITASVKIRKPIHFVDKEYSTFSMGFGKKPPILSDLTRRHVETKCIATMLAHIGFIDSSSSVLDVLTDVFETFMKKICSDLRSSNDSVLIGQPCGFSDIIEQVLIQNGLGGVRGICEYYEKRIKKYENRLKERCQSVASKYDMLLAPNAEKSECKTERPEDLDSEDIPEVHFTTMDGEEGYLQPFLESGFQMLNSLEEGQYVT